MFLDPPSVMASPATPKRGDEVARARIQDRLAAKAVKKTRIEGVNCVRLFELGAQGSQTLMGSARVPSESKHDYDSSLRYGISAPRREQVMAAARTANVNAARK
jgi:hypothetical protein